MSNSDSDSDTPGDIHETLGLPSITADGKSPTEPGEEDKALDNGDDVSDGKPERKTQAFNKFRDQAKDLVANTEKKKQPFLSGKKVNKLNDGSATTTSSTSKPSGLEINDPRFNYDIILEKGYKLIKKMGNGAYASVFLSEKVENPGELCVLKISIGEERMPDTQNEYDILSNLDFPSIPKVEKIILDEECYYSIICMEYSHIDHNILQYVQENDSLDEQEVKSAMKELFSAIKYIHSLDYAHRDVKPDNVLIKISEPTDDSSEKKVEIILVDYNIAKKAKSYRFKQSEDKKEVEQSGKFRCNYLTHIASQNSQAPELFKSGYYTESVDIWGAGLVMFTLITGEKLKRNNEEMIKEQVQNIPNLSQPGKDLLLQMFSYEGEDRPTAEEALHNAWFDE